jgi:hypothetical protein
VVLRSRVLGLSLGFWGVSAAIGCGGTSNDFFAGAAARSGGTGALGGGGGTAGTPAEPRGGTAGNGGSYVGGESGAAAAAHGGGGGSHATGNGGDSGDAGAGDGDAGAPIQTNGGAPATGQSGSANGGDGNAGVAGDENAGGVNAGDAGEGGRASGGDGGRTIGGGGEVATSGHGGDGGASLGGKDGSGGAPANGGVPGVAGAPGDGAGAGGRESGGEGGQTGACEDAERCDGLDNDCNAEVDEGGVCPESCRGFELEGRAYMFCTGARGHFASARVCRDAAMDLVRIDSASENAGVLASVLGLGQEAPLGSIHIGATDFGLGDEGNFRWPDGAVFWVGNASGSAVNGAYTHWDQGEPNNYEANEDCVEMLVTAVADKAGLWNDVRCSSTLSFVCEE